MKNLLVCLFLTAAFSGFGQGVYTYPQWNPDANYSGFIEAGDLLSLLTVFGQPFAFNDTASCEYNGTPFESFISDVINEDVILDSLSVQFILSDVTDPYFVAGCPSSVQDTVQTFYSFMLHRVNSKTYEGDGFRFKMFYDLTDGGYGFYIGWIAANTLDDFTSQGLYGDDPGTNEQYVSRPHYSPELFLPFEPTFGAFDSTGISFLPLLDGNWRLMDYGWDPYYFGYGSNYFDSWADYITHWNMIPFWHYAE